jgi:DNA replication and repair protein RecF
MRVCQLKLNSFRNYRELDLRPGEGLNILYGANAQGKSNILEALWLLATTRSLRASRESELILHDAEMAHVTAEIDRDREGDVELQVSVFQGENKKAVRVNGMKRDRIIDLLGQFNAVFFGALDLNIVTGEPTDRRHYLNLEISQISPRYVVNLGHYKRVLQQRNRLLRDLRDRPRPPADVGLDAWTQQLVHYGAPLLDTRRFYVERLAPLAAQIHRELTDGKETLEVRYAPSFPLPALPEEQERADEEGTGKREQEKELSDAGRVREATAEDRYLAEAAQAVGTEETSGISLPDSIRRQSGGDATTLKAPPSALSATQRIANAFHAQLVAVGLEEARRGSTLIGPQRDDLCFLINGADARTYGSQGQQRTVALSLKLAEFRLIEEYVGEPPVMLLDDVMSDLDDSRRRHLLKWVRGRGQTFITCTSLRAFPKEILAEAVTYQVAAGTIVPDVKPDVKTAIRSRPQSAGSGKRATGREQPADPAGVVTPALSAAPDDQRFTGEPGLAERETGADGEPVKSIHLESTHHTADEAAPVG